MRSSASVATLHRPNVISLYVSGICEILNYLQLCSRNDQKYALIVPLLYSIYWLLHVSAVGRHHQGAS
jgi:hypothetical protein